MTHERKAAVLACLAALPFFTWMIFPELTLGGLLKMGVACVIGAGVAMAIPCKDEKDEES
jgi:hypothetical protein